MRALVRSVVRCVGSLIGVQLTRQYKEAGPLYLRAIEIGEKRVAVESLFLRSSLC